MSCLGCSGDCYSLEGTAKGDRGARELVLKNVDFALFQEHPHAEWGDD
jgi:hypothetical protein